METAIQICAPSLPRAGPNPCARDIPPSEMPKRDLPQVSCPPSSSHSAAVMELIPALRAFARSLCGNTADADDLVQDTLLRGFEKHHLFQPGTNLRAWLFTILRNRFYSNWNKHRREPIAEPSGVSEPLTSAVDGQYWHLRLRELEAAMLELPVHQRETLMLVGVLGESYESAAEILGCNIGTVKSRVNRARAALQERVG